MYKEVATVSGKTEGVVRSIFEYFDSHPKDVFWEVINAVSKKYNMTMITATYIYRCWQVQGVA